MSHNLFICAITKLVTPVPSFLFHLQASLVFKYLILTSKVVNQNLHNRLSKIKNKKLKKAILFSPVYGNNGGKVQTRCKSNH